MCGQPRTPTAPCTDTASDSSTRLRFTLTLRMQPWKEASGGLGAFTAPGGDTPEQHEDHPAATGETRGELFTH